MGWGKPVTYVLILALLSTVSFADIITSGDGGAQFVNDTAAAQCQQPHVQAVYKCLGDIVRVVSSVPGEGSTFYKPDGRVVRCPVVPPSQMGAECLALMGPNYCPTQAECGESPAPAVFPGQNDTPEQTGDASAYIVQGRAASDSLANQTDLAPTAQPAPKPAVRAAAPKANELDIPEANKNNIDSPIGFLVYIVIALGIGAVGLLFFLFKNSISEDEEG
jgi:hypothetical protein